MASMHASTHADEHDDTVHHEESDIDIRAIFIAAVVLVALTAFCYAAVWGTYKVLEKRADTTLNGREYPLAKDTENRLPPAPRLQVDPKQELLDMRADEEKRLDGYHWVDRNNGLVRIPIEEAMKLTIQRGLPSRAQAGAAAPVMPSIVTPGIPALAPAEPVAAEH
jgi:hypothetical protein